MTVESSNNKSGPFIASGATGVFPRNFLVFDPAHVRVVRSRDGVETDITTGISHSGMGSASGTVTLTQGIQSGDRITLLRNMPNVQRSDYSAQSSVPTDQVELDFDLLAMQVQDLAERQRRALTLPVDSTQSGEEAMRAALAAPRYASQAMTAALRAEAAAGMVVNVKQYGATGDGVTDDTTAVQMAIDDNAGKTLLFPAGVYLCRSLVHRPGTELNGIPGLSVIKAHPSLPTTQGLLAYSGTAFSDSGFRLEGLIFDGSSLGKSDATQTRLGALVRYTKATGLTIRNCRFRDYGYQLISGRSMRDVLIEGCEFSGAGYLGTTANGGSAVWINQTDADLCKNVRILNCHIHDNEWHGSHVGGIGILIQGNVYERNKENHVFSTMIRGGDNPAITTRDLNIIGNTFRDVSRKDISSHGLELQTWGGVISGNIISGCDHGGIALSRSRDVVISGNQIKQFGLIGSVYGGIDIYNTASGAAQTANLEVSGNVIGMDAEGALTVAGIRSIKVAGGDDPKNISIHDNNLSGAAFTAGKVVKAAWDATTCRHWDNRGAGDDRPFIGTQTVSAGGMLTVTGLPFSPQWIEFTAYTASATTARWSSATAVVQTGTIDGVSVSVDGSARRAGGMAALEVVSIKGGSGAEIATAAIDSFTADGFKLNFTALTAPITLRYTAHP